MPGNLNLPTQQQIINKALPVIPKTQAAIANKQLLVKVVPRELASQASIIIKRAGLDLIKEKLYIVDSDRMAEEQATYQSSDQNPYGFDKQNSFGMLFDVIVLKGLSYTDFNGQVINLGDFTLDIALVDARLPRNIVVTQITGKDGDVHEYMGDGDWNIKISGVLLNPLSNVPPETLVRALYQFCIAKKEIEVTSTILSWLNIFSIVITEPRFTQRKGERNAIDYELYCLSETPFELK